MSLEFLTSPAGLALVAAGALVWSLIATRLAITLAHRHALHAVPDHRSSHTIPTPRIGGIGIAGPPLLMLLALTILRIDPDHDSTDLYLFFLLGVSAFCYIGLYDDIKGLSPKKKIAAQFGYALFGYPIIAALNLFMVRSLLGVDTSELMSFTFPPISSVLLVIVLWIVWIVGFVNAYNFMDGMNGKAGVFAVVVLLAFWGIVASANPTATPLEFGPFYKPAWLPDDGFLLINVTTLGALLGFLYFNCRTNAPIFLGDSGSHLVGYLIAALAFYASDSLLGPGRSLLAFAIVLVPFIYDVAITLIKRARAGEKVWEAHRGHLYQRLMVTGYGHMHVLAICVITYIACGALGVACAVAPGAVYRAVALALSLLVMACYHFYVLRVEARA